jgi:hypothetical protein
MPLDLFIMQESTWSVLGEAAGRAAAKARRDRVAMQDVNVAELQSELEHAVRCAPIPIKGCWALRATPHLFPVCNSLL